MLSNEQQKIVSYFKNAIQNDALRHAYIIKGARGIGKNKTADAFQLYFACKTLSACGECNGCKSACLGANPDIIRVSNGDKKAYEVAKIRELIKKVYEKPIVSKHKLIIVENAHLLGEICQNALLKAIEEPPSYAVFILLCDNISGILPTILSRVMVIELMPWKRAELEAICPLDKDSSFLYDYAMGNPGTLLAISADEQFRHMRDEAIESFQKLISPGEFNVYDALDSWVASKENVVEKFSVLTLFLRDVMFFKNGQRKAIINTDKLMQIEAVSSKVTFSQALKMTETVLEAPSLMGRNENLNMAVQAIFMKLKEQLK